MKNSASEVFCMDHAAAYQHAFGYIRQLAIHLRNSMKVKTKVCPVNSQSINLTFVAISISYLSGGAQTGLQLAIRPLC